jgi:phosphate transport system permease protein
MAQAALDDLLYAEKWVPVQGQAQLVEKRIPRVEQFAGTQIEPLFAYVRDHMDQMLLPEWTFYWRYFINEPTVGYVFGGVGPHVIGTLSLTLVTMVVAVPLGVISAAFLVETAGDNLLTRVIRTCVNTLAGVPSIVFGLFGLAFFVLWFLPKFGVDQGPTILAGGLTLALLVLPVVIRASEEAIRSVPQTYKEASLSLGASGLRTFITVTLPAALPGILTGIILSLSRAAGETAPVMLTAVVALKQGLPESVADSTVALSYGAYDIAVGDRLAEMVPHKQFGMVMTLIVIVLILNIAAILLRSRLSRRLRGM